MQRNEVSTLKSAGRDRLACLLLGLMTLALYSPARHFDFNNYDDAQYVTQNFHIQSGLTWKSAAWAFTSGYASNWHPITWLSHALDWELYGTNAGGHHLTGILFHVANTVLLFLLLRQLTGGFWRCVFVAALFGWHPLHVESVAWVAERKDVLSGFFGLLTLLAYVRHAKEFPAPHPKWRGAYGLALLFFTLGLMSKPMLVSLPLVMLLLDYWPLNRLSPQFPVFNLRLWTALVREKIPFLFLSAASCAVTFLVQRNGQSVQSLQNLSLHERVANALVAYATYVEKLLWPANLCVIYPYSHHLPVWQTALSAVLLGLVSWLAWRLRRTHPWWIAGWAWFVITLVPVIGLVQVGGQSMADRYSYLPSIGFFAAITWEVGRVVQGWMRTTAGLAAALLLTGCLITTSIQLGYWQNSVTLFSRAVAVTKDNAVAECDLGNALMLQGRKAEAFSHFQQALRIDPNYLDALINMGSYLTDTGKLDEAAECFRKVLRSGAPFSSALARAHTDLGIILASKGRTDEAVAEFQQALACEPDNAHAQNGWGRVLELRGNLPEAAAHYSAALAVKPDFAEAHDNLGAVLTAQGKFAEAALHFQSALNIRPDFADAHYNLGNALAALGHLDEAAAQYEATLKQQQDYWEAHFNLALVLVRARRTSEAIPHYRTTLRLKPGFVPAQTKLAWLLATSSDDKLRDGTEALQLANLAAQSGQPDVGTWDALAAACAENGKFTEAIGAAHKALNAAQESGRRELAAQIQKRLDLYASGKPFREP